jgi:hypothetical protein
VLQVLKTRILGQVWGPAVIRMASLDHISPLISKSGLWGVELGRQAEVRLPDIAGVAQSPPLILRPPLVRLVR